MIEQRALLQRSPILRVLMGVSCVVLLPLFVFLADYSWDRNDIGAVLIALVLAMVCAGFLLVAISPMRFAVAGRLSLASVTLGYVAYFCHQFFVLKKPFVPTWKFSEPSPFSAFMGCLLIGLPAVLYAIRGFVVFYTSDPVDESSGDSDQESSGEGTT